MAEFPRSDWAARPPKVQEPPLVNVPYGALHHIGGGSPYPSNVVATLQQIQSTEQHGDYVDIAYNWGVDKDGNQWELRGDVHDGATKGYAGVSFSVLAICNASAPNFVATPQLLSGIAACFKQAQARGVLSLGADIEGHHWFDEHVTSSPTVCPGTLEQSIGEIRSLVAAKKASPMFHPPLQVIAALSNTQPGGKGAWGLGPDGGVFSFGAPLPKGVWGVNGQKWFVGTPTGLEAPNADELKRGAWYVVTNENRQRYAFGPNGPC